MARRKREGFILVSVLSIVALLATLVGGMSMLARSAVGGAQGAGEELALRALARAGVELAAYQLYGLKLPLDQIDAQQVRLDAGTVTLFVTDESGKVDLNGAAPALLAAAYRAAGLSVLSPSAFAARVADWRDEDDERTAGGAEAADYRAAGLDYAPQNDEFRSVGDLRWLLGLQPEHVAALEPFMTVHNPDGKVNVLSAKREVLLALPGIDPAMAERILALRADRTEAGAANLRQLLQAQGEFIKLEPGPSYRLRVEARLRNGRVKSTEVVLAPSRKDDALYYVVEWIE